MCRKKMSFWRVVKVLTLCGVVTGIVDVVNGELDPASPNVCKQLLKYSQNETLVEEQTRVVNYTMCCMKVFWHCMKTCTKTRTKIEKIPRTVTVVKYKFEYYCCQGYERNGDTCIAPKLDECVKQPCRCVDGYQGCNATCLDSTSGYSCQCSDGYRLQANGNICEDFDECSDARWNACDVTQRCVNHVGGYSCVCKDGYAAMHDGKCKALQCKSISPPFNGKMICDGNTTGSVCRFTCNQGYSISGPTSRKCRNDALWDGYDVTCSVMQCSTLQAPANGAVVMPCKESLDSNCFIKCKKGYFLDGEHITKCTEHQGVAQWIPNNVTCEANTPCIPSPCLHSGKCSVVRNNFLCDCSGTSYTGPNCNMGFIDISPYSQLIVNKTSSLINVRARPDRYVELIPYSSDAIFVPGSIILSANVPERTFVVKAKSPGAIIIKYEIRGPDARSFKVPSKIVVYASSVERKIKPITTNSSLFNTCHRKIQRVQCSNVRVFFRSNCKWSGEGSGFITVSNNNLEIPLSLNGLFGSRFHSAQRSDIISPRLEIENYLIKRQLSSHCESCGTNSYSSSSVDYLILNNYFQNIVLKKFVEPWPYWFDIQLNTRSFVTPENLITNYGKGKDVLKLPACSELPLISTHSYVVYKPLTSLRFKFSSIDKKTHHFLDSHCFAFDLCENKVHVALPKSELLDFTENLKEMGLTNVRIKVSTLSLLDKKECHSFKIGHKKTCDSRQIMMKVLGSIKTRSAHLALDGSMYMDDKDLDKVLLTKFNKRNNIVYTGHLVYTIDIEMGGKTLSILDKSKNAEMLVDVGGSDSNLCPFCKKKGLFLKLNATSHSFNYAPSSLKFEPTNSLNVFLPYDLTGGQVIGVTNLPELKLRYQQLRLLSKFLNNEIKRIAEFLPADVTIVRELNVKLSNSLRNFSSTLKLQNMLYKDLHLNLKFVKSIIFDVKAVLKSLKPYLISSKPSLSLIRRILKSIKQMEHVNIRYEVSKVKSVDQGVVVTYTGRFCFYQLCMNNAEVKIEDVVNADTCTMCKKKPMSRDYTVITVRPKTHQTLSSRISMKKNQSIRLYVDKSSDRVQGYIHASFNLFDVDHPMEFRIENSNISFVKNLKLFDGFSFDIKNSISVGSAKWTNLVKQIVGESRKIPTLLNEAQSFYERNAKNTTSRLNSVDVHVRKANKKYLHKKRRLHKLEKEFKEASFKHKRTLTKYKRNLIKLAKKEKLEKLYLKNDDELRAIDKKLNELCDLKTCVSECIQLPVCQICRDKITRNINTMKCQDMIQFVQASVKVPYKTHCDSIYYNKTRITTGECTISPNENELTIESPEVRVLSNKPSKKLYGSINNLFSSCDKSFRNIYEGHNVRRPCIQMRKEVKTVLRPASKCSYKEQVKIGRGAPKVCKCQSDQCVARLCSPKVIISNSKCEKKRMAYLRTTDGIPKEYIHLKSSIRRIKEHSQRISIEVEKQRKNKRFFENQYSIAHNLFNNSQQESLFANSSRQTVPVLLKKEVCLLEQYQQKVNLTQVIDVIKIEFTQKLPFVDNILLNVEILRKESMSTQIIPFYFNFDDRHMSIKLAAKKIVNTALCSLNEKKWRRRKSTNGIESNEEKELLSTAWYYGSDSNLSKIQKACISLQKVINFLNEMASILLNFINDSIDIKREMHSSFAHNALFTSTANNSYVIEAQNDMILSLEADLTMIQKSLTVEHVLRDAREQLELYVSVNDYTICLNFEDCVNSAFETLETIPSVFAVSREQYDESVEDSRKKIQSVFSSNDQTLSSLSALIQSFNDQIYYIRSVCLHCSNKPSIPTHKTPIQYEVVMVGQKTTINCIYESILPTTIYWMKNEEVIDGKHGQQLTINATLDDNGVYKCMVVSAVGKTTSNDTLVIIYSKPSFLSQPKNVTYTLPNHHDNATFVCNVTAEPMPKIKWYYRSFSWTRGQMLYGEYSPLLAVKNPSNKKAGYYYCVGENKYGKTKSEEARLDILKSNLATQKISMSVRVKEYTNTSRKFSQLEKEMTLFEGLTVVMNLNSHGIKSKINVHVFSDPNILMKKLNEESMMDAASKSRQMLAKSMAVFVSHVMNGSIRSDNETVLKIDKGSLMYEYRLNICQAGYKMDADGYTCVQCPVGTYGQECTVCKRGWYQPNVAQIKCIPCANEMITKSVGSVSNNQCYSLKNYCKNRAPGYYPHPTYCSKYIMCNDQTYVRKCQRGLYYDHANSRCVWLFEVSIDAYVKYLKEWWDSCDW